MDPTGGGIGKAAAEMLREMQQAQAELQQKAEKTSTAGSGSPSFQDAMQANAPQSTSQVQQAGKVEGASSARNVLLDAKVTSNTPTTSVGQTARVERSKMAGMLDKLVSGQDKMSKIMDMALSGRKFEPQELLAMQAGVYRFSQELELTSKVVEKATGGIKQTMNTQV